jgi:glutamyl-tRNA synthetase
MVKTRIEVFPDIDEMVSFFESLPEYDISLYQNKKWKVTPEKSLAVLSGLLPMLQAQEDWSNDALYEVLKAYSEKEGVKAGFTIWPVRIAVSGKSVTPAGATEIMEVLGKEESLSRISEGIRKLTEAQ